MKTLLVVLAMFVLVLGMSCTSISAGVIWSENFNEVTDFTNPWITNAPPAGAGWLQSAAGGNFKVTMDTPFGSAAIDGSTSTIGGLNLNLVHQNIPALGTGQMYMLKFKAIAIEGKTEFGGLGFYFNSTDWHGEWPIMLTAIHDGGHFWWRFDTRLVTGFDDYFAYPASGEISECMIVIDAVNNMIWASVSDSLGTHESVHRPIPADTIARITGISCVQMFRTGDYDKGMDIDDIVLYTPEYDEMNLLLSYDFSSSCGNIATDISGNQLDGQIVGAEWIQTTKGGALKFDGYSSYITCSNSLAGLLNERFCIEAWVYVDGVPEGEDMLIAGIAGGKYSLTYGNSGRFWLKSVPYGKMCRARAPTTLWQHVVAVVDNSTIRIYLNGVLDGGVRNWHYGGLTSGNISLIGGGSSSSNFLKGKIAKFRIYNQVLSKEQIYQLYSNLKNQYQTPIPLEEEQLPANIIRLNNAVLELLNVNPTPAQEIQLQFENPRDGWVFVAASLSCGVNSSANIYLNNDSIINSDSTVNKTYEAMRYLRMGSYSIRIVNEGEVQVDRVIVRAIPELIYGAFSNPNVFEYGDYDWDFLKKFVLPNANCIFGGATEQNIPYINEWKSQGKKWICETNAPYINPNTQMPVSSTDEMFNLLVDKDGLKYPYVDGPLLDTFDVGHWSIYGYFTGAIERIRNDPVYESKSIYNYCDILYGADESESFARAVLNNGYHLVWTKYLQEIDTEEGAWSFLRSRYAHEMSGWLQAIPGIEKNMVIGLGYLSAPPETMNTIASVNYLYYMDMQCNVLANDPEFRDFYGVLWYKATYGDEEAVKWAAKLYRHYFIEGRKDMLSQQYGFTYNLNHVANPDFENGTNGWDISSAEPNSIEVVHLNRLGYLEGRWLETIEGDDAIKLTRSDIAPNRISQTISNLVPGNLYSLKMYSADYQGLLIRQTQNAKNVLSIDISDVDMINERCFDHVFKNISYHNLQSFDDTEEPSDIYLNFHRRVFLAANNTAQLEISDWRDSSGPGGTVGQELLLNFIEVQPYYEPLTISIDNPSASVTNSSPVTYPITYSGANSVTLTAGNITLNKTGTANGTAAVSGTGNMMRTVTILDITGNGTLGISISAGTASDSGGYFTPATGPSTTFSVDNTDPTISIGSRSTSLTRGGPVTYTITYDGANSITLAPDNVTLNKTGTADGTVTVSGTNTTTRTVKISSITGTGTLGISIADGTASDFAGNSAPAAGPSDTFIVDNTAPTVTSIVRKTPIGQYYNGNSVVWTVTFSELMKATTVSIEDFTLTDVSSSIMEESITNVSPTTGITSAFDVTCITGSGNGTLRLDVLDANASINDQAGNEITANFTTGETYIISAITANVTLNDWTATSNVTLPFQVEYKKSGTLDVLTVVDMDFLVTPGAGVGTALFSLNGLPLDTYDIWVKCTHWLAKMTPDINILVNPDMGNVILINGDVVDNNEVDFTDINAARAAYGSFPGDETWNEQADVDGSGEVDFTDINIVRANYGEIGE